MLDMKINDIAKKRTKNISLTESLKPDIYPPLERAINEADARNRQIQTIVNMVDIILLSTELLDEQVDIGDVIDIICTISEHLDQNLRKIEHIARTGTVEAPHG